MGTLAVRLAVPLTGSAEDSPSLGHLLGVRPAGRTKEKLRRVCAVEITVEVGGLVEHLDVALGCGPPLDERHQRSGMGLQRCAVIIDAVQHHGGNREHHPRWRELSFGEDVMYQTAVHSPVAVLEPERRSPI